LKVAACTDPTCTGATFSIVDTGTVGQHTSITIGADANPIISYQNANNGALMVAACTNPTCTGATLSTVDGTGSYTSITIGADANPIISYYDGGNKALKVAACTNPTCTGATLSTVDTVDTGNVGQYTSITIGADANPIISYRDSNNGGALKVAACTNPTCNPIDSVATRSTVSTGGYYTSITIGADANPIISYFDNGNGGALKVAACTNPTCTGATLSTLDTVGVGQHTSITIGADANPIISYHDYGNSALKVAKLTRTSWTPNTWES
jgi:hypothetical protein